MTGASRREHTRVAARISVSVRAPDGRTINADEIANISLGGVFIEMREPLAFGTDVDLEFSLSAEVRTIRCKGFVVWSTVTSPERGGGRQGIGVRLMDIGVREMRILNEFIERRL
ncbi:MAG: PilZ domain-containing protein [Deltaproteobacteria bacterium]|nr:PilZ domain-containing protein [Deltaproteobacteria bacterium]